MNTEIRLFSQKSFIEASKKFVCVRLGSYESKKHQDMVRGLLRGSFQNTAFVVFSPDGKKKLTRSGRSPEHAFGRNVEQGMAEIAKKYRVKGNANDAVLSDFHSFKQSLNVASADQRLLVLTVASQNALKTTSPKIKKVFNDAEVSGRYFFDTAGKADAAWAKSLKGATRKTGIFIIKSGQFGTDGEVMTQLSLDSSAAKIKVALKAANAKFAKTEKRKVYNEHVTEGRKAGIDYQNEMPPGEDRDGDGKVDPKPERGGRGEGRPPRRR